MSTLADAPSTERVAGKFCSTPAVVATALGHDSHLGLRGYLTKLLRGEVHAQRASSTRRGSEIAAAMSRKRRVWSRPLRLTRRLRLPSLSINIRQPSTFSSYTHPSRWKGSGTSVGPSACTAGSRTIRQQPEQPSPQC